MYQRAQQRSQQKSKGETTGKEKSLYYCTDILSQMSFSFKEIVQHCKNLTYFLFHGEINKEIDKTYFCVQSNSHREQLVCYTKIVSRKNSFVHLKT